MAKITDLPQGSGLSATDVFPYVDVPNNTTKKYPASGLLSALASADTSGGMTSLMENATPGIQHRMFYGGRYLGASVTSAQKTAIQDGSFKGLLVGDYWSINGVNWRIADMDYWYGNNIPAFGVHHLAIMPDTTLINAKMNDTDTTTGGFVGSKMYTDTLPTVLTTCQAAFPSMILAHPEYLTSAVTNGLPSAATWKDVYVTLPDEIMMYGCRMIAPSNNGATIATIGSADKSKLALFNLNPFYIKASSWFWLRDVVSATHFTCVSSDNLPYVNNASRSGGVRPVFAIGVE